ncbi:hypothetical protein FHW96_004868 [Novosphingobium sp. SG751A]|nr:hypothetical protein [Novosphingobium sp. SG751A]
MTASADFAIPLTFEATGTLKSADEPLLEDRQMATYIGNGRKGSISAR